MKAELLQAIAVTAELTATELSKDAARALADDLDGYPVHAVLNALRACRRELTGRLTLAAVIQRIEDGRPGPEEALAHCSPLLGDESRSVTQHVARKEKHRNRRDEKSKRDQQLDRNDIPCPGKMKEFGDIVRQRRIKI